MKEEKKKKGGLSGYHSTLIRTWSGEKILCNSTEENNLYAIRLNSDE